MLVWHSSQNYLSHYFQALAEAITSGEARFKRPRRTDGLRFYERCLPASLVLRPWPASLPRVQPIGRWDWFVFNNATADFWISMRPLVRIILRGAFERCGLRATVRAPVLHFRCASAPLNRHSQCASRMHRTTSPGPPAAPAAHLARDSLQA